MKNGVKIIAIVSFSFFAIILASSFVMKWNLLIISASNNNVECGPEELITLIPQSDINSFTGDVYLCIREESMIPFMRRSCYRLKDDLKIRELLESWRFSCTGGDMATLGSEIIIANSDGTIARYGIALDETMGIQSVSTGWAEAINSSGMADWKDQFDRCMSPVVLIN